MEIRIRSCFIITREEPTKDMITSIMNKHIDKWEEYDIINILDDFTFVKEHSKSIFQIKDINVELAHRYYNGIATTIYYLLVDMKNRYMHSKFYLSEAEMNNLDYETIYINFLELMKHCDNLPKISNYILIINVLKGRKDIADIEKYLNWIPSEYIFDNIWVSCEESCGKNNEKWQNHFTNMWKETDDNYWVTTVKFERKK